MRGAWSILALALIAHPVFAAKTPEQRAAELRQVKADYAKACAGQGKNIDASFTEADGTLDQIRTDKGIVTFYREATPESLDWTADDTYIFSAATGKRLQFARAVTYAGRLFAYVKTIDANGRVADNARALPEGWYLTDEPAFTTLNQVCHFKPAKAGHD